MAVMSETITAPAGTAESRSEIIAFFIMVAVLIAAPLLGVYPLFLMQALCFALFACAFNLLIGYVGLLSFGHALYFGWASYLAAHSARVGLPPELAILTGTLTAAILGIAGARRDPPPGHLLRDDHVALAQMLFSPCRRNSKVVRTEFSRCRVKMFGILDSPINNMYAVVACSSWRASVHPADHQLAVRPGMKASAKTSRVRSRSATRRTATSW